MEPFQLVSQSVIALALGWTLLFRIPLFLCGIALTLKDTSSDPLGFIDRGAGFTLGACSLAPESFLIWYTFWPGLFT